MAGLAASTVLVVTTTVVASGKGPSRHATTTTTAPQRVAVHSTAVVTRPTRPSAPTHMPRLIGLTRAQVYGVMRRHNLYFVTKGPGAAKGNWVDVTSQSPRPGAVVAYHAQATLHVSTVRPRGPRPMPRLIGLTRAQAYAVMHRASLYFNTVGTGASNGSWTRVIGQNPKPGTKVGWHSSATLNVMSEPPVTNVPLVPGRIQVGDATWYNYVPGDCASSIVPKGTRLYVRDLATGKTITCLVTDIEDAGPPRIVDLSETQFSELAPLAKGVVRVRVSW